MYHKNAAEGETVIRGPGRFRGACRDRYRAGSFGGATLSAHRTRPCETGPGSGAVLVALLSLSGVGVNNVVFQRYAAKDRSRGGYVCGIGVVWTVLRLALAQARGMKLTFGVSTLRYGAAAGVLLTASNLLLLASLTRFSASLGFTIYRLSTVGIVLSLLLLHEPLGVFKGVSSRGSAGRGELDILGGAGYTRFRERRVCVTSKKAFYGAVSGVLVFLIANVPLRAVEAGQASGQEHFYNDRPRAEGEAGATLPHPGWASGS